MSLRKLSICVIDDEAPIRRALIDELNNSLQMEVVGEGESVEEAVAIICEKKPDAVFLDIKLRAGDAYQVMDILRREMDELPAIIINTGYSDFEYAQRILNQYKDCVVSLLQKPFWEDWRKKENDILDRIYDYYEKKVRPNSAINQRIIIKSAYKSYVFLPDDIMYIEVQDQGENKGKVFVETIDRQIYLNKKLSSVMDLLPRQFIRVSRFLIINLDHLDYYDHSDHCLYLKGLKRYFGVGSAYEKTVLNAI